jgi:hypothetical protein
MPGYATTLRNAKLDANTTFIGNAALLRIYSGTKPAVGAAITTETKLAEFTLGTPFAPAASAGAQSPTLPSATTGLAAGTASWYRIVKADGTTHCMDGTAGTSAAELILNTTTISSGVAVSVTGWTITGGNAT